MTCWFRVIFIFTLFFALQILNPKASANQKNDLSSTPTWLDHWEKIPANKLPTLTPDGDLGDFQESLERQMLNCHEHDTGQYSTCPNETQDMPTFCDLPVLARLLALTQTSPNWKTFYKQAKKTFVWYRYKTAPNPADAQTPVQFTGYNAPLFEGTLRPDAKHRYPAYNRPSDLVTATFPDGSTHWGRYLPDGSFTPYDDRKKIDVDGSLNGKNLELAYFEFPSDLLRLHIEGSGVFRAKLDDGSTRDYVLNYNGQNGLPFVSVFKIMKQNGVAQKYMSFPGLKQYFIDFPNEMWPTLITDPSYVFFSLSDEPPCGAVRTNLTPGHSVAVDPTQLPLGMATLFQAERPVEGHNPDTPNAPTKPFTRFAVAQDTGGAIKNGHVDVYWGTGDYAMLASNQMNSRGNLFLMMLPKAKHER